MKAIRSIEVIDTHTAGEPTRVVVGGLPPVPGETMLEKQAWFESLGSDLLRFLLQEPRGHNGMFGAAVFPPSHPDADVGVVFLETGGTLAMCGHGTIGVVTALIETGHLEGDTVTLDTSAGLVRCTVQRDVGRICGVTFRNVPAFFLDRVEHDGRPVDLSYGGNLFALVDAERLGIHLRREELPRLISHGMTLLRWFEEKHAFRHPESGAPLPVELVEFYEHGNPDRNVVVFGPGQVDRSPCGTGTCAKMAYLHARGMLRVGEPYPYRSILDTEFVGRIVETTTIGGTSAVIPEISGSAYVTGMGTLVLTEGDPFPAGFCLMPSETETSPLLPRACADVEQDRPPSAG